MMSDVPLHQAYRRIDATTAISSHPCGKLTEGLKKSEREWPEFRTIDLNLEWMKIRNNFRFYDPLHDNKELYKHESNASTYKVCFSPTPPGGA